MVFFLLSLLGYLRFDTAGPQGGSPGAGNDGHTTLSLRASSLYDVVRPCLCAGAAEARLPWWRPCRWCFYWTGLVAAGTAGRSETVWRSRLSSRRHWSHPADCRLRTSSRRGVGAGTTASGRRLAGAGWGFWFYLYKAVLPLDLCFVYPRWRIDPTSFLSYVPGLLVVLLFAVCWRYRQGWGRAALFGLGYFLVMLLPALGFVNIYFMRYSLVSDHWQYFAILGPIGVGRCGPQRRAALRAGRIPDFLGGPAPQHRGSCCGTLLLALGVLSWEQSRNYTDMETLWRVTL